MGVSEAHPATGPRGADPPGARQAVVWHDLECGGYRADLPLWRELAAAAPGPVAELGTGTGRVALELAGAGRRVIGVDRDEGLLAALADRARDRGVEVEVRRADLRRARALPPGLALVLGPMQVLQLMGGQEARLALLAAVARALTPGGLAAFALVCDIEPFVEGRDVLPVPDMTEVDGVVFSSRPTGVTVAAGRCVLERRREIVWPDGRRHEQEDRIELDLVGVREVEAEAARAGLRPAGRRMIEATDEHVASEVVVLRRPDAPRPAPPLGHA